MGLSDAMFILQLVLVTILFCAINIFSLRKGPRGFIQHYPADVQTHAVLLGEVTRGYIITKEKLGRAGAWALYSVAIVLIIAILNGFTGFFPLYIQAFIFMEWLNLFDGLIIEGIILHHVPKLMIPGTEEMLKSAGHRVYIKRRVTIALLTIPYSAVLAGIAMLIQG